MCISGNCDGDVEGPLVRFAVGDAWVHYVIFCQDFGSPHQRVVAC